MLTIFYILYLNTFNYYLYQFITITIMTTIECIKNRWNGLGWKSNKEIKDEIVIRIENKSNELTGKEENKNIKKEELSNKLNDELKNDKEKYKNSETFTKFYDNMITSKTESYDKEMQKKKEKEEEEERKRKYER